MATNDELMAEACRLASESAVNGWGPPFGAVIARDGEIVARGQNRILLSGDPTAHAEMEAIRKAIRVLNPWAPSISAEHMGESTLAYVQRDDPDDPVPARARMLKGMTIFSSGAPCPMCMTAIYWARLDAVYFSADLAMTRAIGFDDAGLYEEFTKPLEERRIPVEQLRPDLVVDAYRAWTDKADKHWI
jgi:guanine deaminase